MPIRTLPSTPMGRKRKIESVLHLVGSAGNRRFLVSGRPGRSPKQFQKEGGNASHFLKICVEAFPFVVMFERFQIWIALPAGGSSANPEFRNPCLHNSANCSSNSVTVMFHVVQKCVFTWNQNKSSKTDVFTLFPPQKGHAVSRPKRSRSFPPWSRSFPP